MNKIILSLSVLFMAVIFVACKQEAAKVENQPETQQQAVAQTPVIQNNPLWDAASAGDILLVRDLVENKNEDVNHVGMEGVTVLMNAVKGGKLEVVEYLVSKGEDVKAKDNNGTTAVMYARGPNSGNTAIEAYLNQFEKDQPAQQGAAPATAPVAAQAAK